MWNKYKKFVLFQHVLNEKINMLQIEEKKSSRVENCLVIISFFFFDRNYYNRAQ